MEVSTQNHIELPVTEGDLAYMLTKCRSILNAAGYYNDVRAINDLLDAYYMTKQMRRPEQAADLDEDIPF